MNNAATSCGPKADVLDAWTGRLANAERERSLGMDAASRGSSESRPGGVRSTFVMGGPSAVFGDTPEDVVPPHLTECGRWSTDKPAPSFSVAPVRSPSAAGPNTGPVCAPAAGPDTGASEDA